MRALVTNVVAGGVTQGGSTLTQQYVKMVQIEEAKKICMRCVVREQCLSWALEAGQDHGVWGGLSEDERRAIKRRAARSRLRAETRATPAPRSSQIRLRAETTARAQGSSKK